MRSVSCNYMKRAILFLIYFLLFTSTQLKSQQLQMLLDSGKSEFKRQDADTLHQFSKAEILLKKVISLDPKNAEARYFLGYTIDRMNSFDGRGMNQMTKEKAILASEQFEMVNKLQPKYNG